MRPADPLGREVLEVFLDNDEAIQRAIRYVEANPAKEGKRPQRWSFVIPWRPAPGAHPV